MSAYDDEEWVSDEALKALALEADLHPEEPSDARAKRLLTENVDVAAVAVIHLAKNSPNERTRLDASKYIMERVLGKAGDSPATGTLDEMFERLDRLANAAPAIEQSKPHSARGD